MQIRTFGMLALASMAVSGCATASGSNEAEREIISRYECKLEYEFLGGTMSSNTKLNDDGTIFARGQVLWEMPRRLEATPSPVNPNFRVSGTSYLLAWSPDMDGRITIATGQAFMSRDIFPATAQDPRPDAIKLGLRVNLDRPGFGNLKFDTDPQMAFGSQSVFLMLDQMLALGRGAGALYGVVTDAENGILLDYWEIDFRLLDEVRKAVPEAARRMEQLSASYKDECTFIEDVEANRIYVTGL